MRYTGAKKRATRETILRSAYALFAEKGFNAVSIDDVMHACSLTRGGFYAHFSSKGTLYREAMQQALVNEHSVLPTSDAAADMTLEDKFCRLIDECTGNAQRDPSRARFAFLAADLANDSADVRASYALAITSLLEYFSATENGAHGRDSKELTAAFAMIIGAAAIVRSVDDPFLRDRFIVACKRMSERLSDSWREPAARAFPFLWEGALGCGFKETSALN